MVDSMEMEDVEDWDEEFGFSEDLESASGTEGEDNDSQRSNGREGEPKNRIVGITADRFVATEDNEWDDDFDFEDAPPTAGGDSFESIRKSALVSFDGEGLPKLASSADVFGDFGKKGTSGESNDGTTSDLQKPSSATTGDTELDLEDEDWEDWDAELGIDETDGAQDLRSAFSAGAGLNTSMTEEMFAARHRILQEKTSVVIIKFASPTMLYSALNGEKEGGLRPFREEKEFSTWITQLLASPLAERDFESVESKNVFNLRKSNFHQDVYQLQKFSEAWCACYLRYCNELTRAGEHEVVWETLLQFFADLESSSGTKLSPEAATRTESLCIHMLQIACKLWTVEEDASFNEMVESAAKLLPRRKDLLELMQAEAYAHHYESAEYMGLSPLDTFCGLYGRQHDAPSLELRARILIDVHLLSEGLSPLTTAKLDIDAELITDQIEEKLLAGSNVEDLLAPQIRVSTLIDLYPKLDIGFLKAKGALAIGIYVSDHERNHRLAERIFFEAVYTLHKVPQAAEGLYPIVSEVGTSCLLRFADKLLYNYKYKYGITAYHAASVAIQLRNRSKDYFNLLRKMATIAKENDDLKRAITYYRELLQMYLNSKKINEVIYVAEAVSKIYSDMGRFSVAEEYLLGAFGKLSKRQQTPSDAKAFQLLLALGKLYLKGPQPERGVLLLEYLNEGKVPRGKARAVFLALGKAYLTLRDFTSCDRLLRLSPVPATPEVPSHRHRRSASSVGTSQIPRKASHREVPAETEGTADVEVEEMQAKNYFRAGKFGEAITAIDACISCCAKSNLNLLAKYFFIRGKILQHVAAPWRQVPPSSITVVSKNGEPTNFSHTSDLFQECIATYTTAYGYCSAVGDDVKAAKVLSRIAEAYLDQVFLPVTLQHRNFDSVSRFKYFLTSPIVRGDSSPPSGVEEFVITLKGIEEPAMLALDIGSGLSDPIILANIFLNVAELRFIMGDKDLALSFWKEAYWALVTLLITPILGQNVPASLLEKVYALTERAVRLLVCFDPRTVINDHLFLFDAVSLLEIALEHAKKRQFTQDDAQQEDGSTMYHILRIHNTVSVRKPWLDTVKEAEAAAQKTKEKRSTKKVPLTRKSTVRGLFGGAGGLDWSMLCNLGETDVTQANLLWAELKCIRTQLSKFSNGKLAQDELFRRNQKYLQNMVKLSKEAFNLRIGGFHGFLQWAEDSKDTNPRSTPFRELVQAHAKLERTMYILNNHGYLLAYTPRFGQFGAQQLFRPHAQTDRDLDKKFHPRYAVRVTPMSDDQEGATFEVKSSVTLKELMYFICNTNQWAFGGAQEDGSSGGSSTLKSTSSKKRVFNSLTRSSSTKHALKFPVKPLEVSKSFVTEVNRLTALVYPPNEEGRSSQEMEDSHEGSSTYSAFSGRLVFGIVATMGDGGEHLIPLTALMEKSMASCFPHSDNGVHPMHFFLYATSHSPPVVAMNENSEQLRQGITVPDSVVAFITKLITGKTETEDVASASSASLLSASSSISSSASAADSSTRGIDKDTLRTCFGWISSLAPRSTSKEAARARRHSIYHKDVENPFACLKGGGYEPIPDTPLLVVCNRAAHAFPWELIFNDVTIRAYALVHVLGRERANLGSRGREQSVVPAFHAFFFPTVDKHRRAEEDLRVRLLATRLLTANKLAPHEFSKSSPVSAVPSSNALRKMWRKKPKLFRTVQWVSAEGALQSRPWDILRRVENLPLNDYSVFLLSYSDLVDVSEVVFYLLSLAPSCTYVFIPRSSQRMVMQRLLKAEVHYRKAIGKKQTLLDRYQYLMSILYNIQKSHQVPIAVINGP